MTKWRSFLPYSKPVFASVLRCIHIKKYYSWEYSENSEMLKNAVLFALCIHINRNFVKIVHLVCRFSVVLVSNCLFCRYITVEEAE